MILVQTRDKWFRAEAPIIDIRVICLFDIVIDIKGTEWTILIDRFGVTEGISDLLKMQIWLTSEKMEQLPTFTHDTKYRGILALGWVGENIETMSAEPLDGFL